MVARLPAALLEEPGNFQKLFQRILKIFWKQASSQDIVKIVENIFGSGNLPLVLSSKMRNKFVEGSPIINNLSARKHHHLTNISCGHERRLATYVYIYIEYMEIKEQRDYLSIFVHEVYLVESQIFLKVP